MLQYISSMISNVCFCCVRFSFSIPSQEISLGTSPDVTYFVSSGTYNLNSVNQAVVVVASSVSAFMQLLDRR